MGWPITFRGERPTDPKVGDAYFMGEDIRPVYRYDFTSQFEQSGRRPILVVLPGGYHFCIDSSYWSNEKPNPDRSGWDVRLLAPPAAGEQLMVTLTPSVNVVGSYHGFIQNGVISDDCEGRRFP